MQPPKVKKSEEVVTKVEVEGPKEVKPEEKSKKEPPAEPITELPGTYKILPRKIPEKKIEAPQVDLKKVEEIPEGFEELKERCNNLDETDMGLQNQIDDLNKKVDKSVPLWMIVLPVAVVAIAAAVYSGAYVFNPVRVAIVVGVSVASVIGAIALYLYRRSKAKK